MAGKNYSIWARLRGRDEASSVFAKIGRNARRSLGGAARAVGGLFGRLKSGLTSLPVIGGAIGGVFGIKGLIDWVGEFAQAGDVIAKTSRQAGISTATFQELQYASGLAGVSAEEFALSMKTLNRTLGDLSANRGPLKELLSKVSPALLKAVKGAKNTEQALDLMFDALAKIKDPARRAVLAQAAFGESGIKMALLTEAGTEAIVAARKEFRELGGVLSDEALASTEQYNDALSRLGVAWKGLKNVFGAAFIRTALPWLNKATEWFKTNQGQIGTMVESFAVDLVEGIKSVITSLPAMAAALSRIAETVGTVFGGIADAARLVGGMWDLVFGEGSADARKKTAQETGTMVWESPEQAMLAEAGMNAAGLPGAWRDAMAKFNTRRYHARRGNEALAAMGIAGTAGPLAGLAPRASDLMLPAIRQATEITVKFENMPKGARVETKGTAPTKVNVGRRTQGETP